MKYKVSKKREKNEMKKTLTTILSIVLVLGLLVCLTGCGENEKKQEAINEFNTTAAAFNEVKDIVNANASEIPEDVIADCQSMAELLNRYQGFLQGDQEFSDEQYDEMIEWFHSVQDWASETGSQLNEAFGG